MPTLRDATALDADELRYAAEISHPALTEPVRIVSDNTAHTIEGNTYTALAFRARRPTEKDGALREVQLEVDNVGRALVQWIDATQGGDGATMRIMQVQVPATPADDSEVLWEVTLPVGIADLDNQRVRIRLANHAIYRRPSVLLRHDAQTSPGLY